MSTVTHIEFEEFFTETLFSDPSHSVTGAVHATVLEFQSGAASSAAFAFVNCAFNLENGLFETTLETADLPQKIYKATALFAADMFAAESLYRRQVTCADIIAVWTQTHDPVFVPSAIASPKKEGDRSPPF